MDCYIFNWFLNLIWESVKKMEIEPQGSEIQEKIINIMEGGEEAFDKRREIYNLWKR